MCNDTERLSCHLRLHLTAQQAALLCDFLERLHEALWVRYDYAMSRLGTDCEDCTSCPDDEELPPTDLWSEHGETEEIPW